MLPTYSQDSRHTICNSDPYVPFPWCLSEIELMEKAQEPVKSPHASPISAPRKKDKDVFDGIDMDSSEKSTNKTQMDGKKVAFMLGKAIWLTIKFIVYVHSPLYCCNND
jgi:hypothetical protein